MSDAKAVLLQEIARLGGDGGDLIDLAPEHRSQQRIVGRSLDEEHFELNGFARSLDRRQSRTSRFNSADGIARLKNGAARQCRDRERDHHPRQSAIRNSEIDVQ